MLRLPGEARSSITEADAPRDRDLDALKARLADLRGFPPAPRDIREAMIARLFMRWQSSGKATAEEVSCYAMDLAEFPMWAISAGIADIIRGLVLKAPQYRPSSLEVRAAVEARHKPAREEAALIDDLLDASKRPIAALPAPMIDPERRKDLAEAVRASMRANAPAADTELRRRHPKLPSAFDAAHDPGRTASVSLSPEAIGKLAETGHVRHHREDAA